MPAFVNRLNARGMPRVSPPDRSAGFSVKSPGDDSDPVAGATGPKHDQTPSMIKPQA